MIFQVLNRLYKRAIHKLHHYAWLVILASIFALYVFGWMSMVAFEENEIVENYGWWFVVTITTVGYGDYSPISEEGRICASIIMIFGIGIIGLVIGKLAEVVIDIASKKAKGLSHMSFKGHTIIMGYRNGSTEKIVKELLVDNPDEDIVLCSSTQQSNPLSSDKIGYIRGELASDDVLKRSNVEHARKIIVHGDDDDQTFFTAYAVREFNTHAHMVCCLMDENHVDKIKRLPADDTALNQVILPANIYLMAQEMQDPESSSVVQGLISNLTGDNLYRYDIVGEISSELTFGDVFYNLKKEYGITVFALKNEKILTNPPLETPLLSGMSIFYTGPKRLREIELRPL